MDRSAPGPSHIISGKSQRSSLPPHKEIVRMKTVKSAIHIHFFLEGFKPLKTSNTNKYKSYRTKHPVIPIANLHFRSCSQAVTVN